MLHMLPSIGLRDCYSAGTYLCFFSHRYLTLIELTKYKCSLFVFFILVAFPLCFHV